GILGLKDELITARERGYRLEIAELERDIAAAEQQVPKDLRELRRIYAMALFETLPANAIGVGRTAHENIALNTLAEQEKFDALITAPNLYYRHANGQRSQHNTSALQDIVDSDESYADRVRSIEHKADAHQKATHR